MAGNYDLIVVGAGPGGSVAAKTAAEAGMRVLLLERSQVPGEKNVSGFGLTSKAYRDFPWLKEMELPSMRVCRKCVGHFLSPPPELAERICLYSGTSSRTSYPEGREFFTVMMLRREFDEYLAGKAEQAGAELRTLSLVTGLVRENGRVAGVLLEGGEEFRAPVVIGADGVLSAVARLSGLREKWRPDEVVSVCCIDYAASRERLDWVIDDAAFHGFFGPGIGGNYFMCMAEGVHLGGPGVGNSLVSRLKRRRINPARELLETIKAPSCRNLLKAVDAVPREWQAHLLPWLDRMPTNIFGAGVMLVGDAAGLPEPIWAEGVWQAMYSGRLAAEVAREVVGEGDVSHSSMQRYLDRLEASPVGRDFIGGTQMRNLFELLGDARVFGDLTEMMVDLFVSMFMNGQEVHAEAMSRFVPILAENLPALMEVGRIYAPVLLEMYSDALRDKVKMIKGLGAMLSSMSSMLIPGQEAAGQTGGEQR